jgi:hypothetical protein
MGNVVQLSGAPGTGAGVDCNQGGDMTNGLTPQEALNIDTKMDDGLPYTGNVQASGGECGFTSGTSGPSDEKPANPPEAEDFAPPTACTATGQSITSGYANPKLNYAKNCNLMFSLGM